MATYTLHTARAEYGRGDGFVSAVKDDSGNILCVIPPADAYAHKRTALWLDAVGSIEARTTERTESPLIAFEAWELVVYQLALWSATAENGGIRPFNWSFTANRILAFDPGYMGRWFEALTDPARRQTALDTVGRQGGPPEPVTLPDAPTVTWEVDTPFGSQRLVVRCTSDSHIRSELDYLQGQIGQGALCHVVDWAGWPRIPEWFDFRTANPSTLSPLASGQPQQGA